MNTAAQTLGIQVRVCLLPATQLKKNVATVPPKPRTASSLLHSVLPDVGWRRLPRGLLFHGCCVSLPFYKAIMQLQAATP